MRFIDLGYRPTPINIINNIFHIDFYVLQEGLTFYLLQLRLTKFIYTSQKLK